MKHITLSKKWVGIFMGLLTACNLLADRIYVSPAGSDSQSGTQDSPLFSLGAAWIKAGEIRSSGNMTDIEIIIGDGTYYLDETLVLNEKVPTPDGLVTRFKAAPGASPVISGGRAIKNWQRASQNIPFLPEVARGKVWVAKAPWFTAENRFHCLMLDGKFLPRSQSPHFSTDNFGKTNGYMGERLFREIFKFQEGFRNWKNIEDIELFIQPTRQWLVNYLPLASVDNEAKIGRFLIPATYSIGNLGGIIENAIDFLDHPGEWALDTVEGNLYYWPLADSPEIGILATFLDELIRIEGNSDSSLSGSAERPVTGIEFEGLTFSHADRQRWQHDDKGIQHDWNMWDKPNGLIRFRSARNCSVRNCRFINSGSDGVRMDLYCQDITIENCHFENLGGTGILLCGYGPGLKDVNRDNRIIGNTITRTGTLYWHSPAIFIWQSGHNVIRQNHIYDLGYTAMVISGVRRRFFQQLHQPKLRELARWNPTADMRENMGTIRWSEISLDHGAADWASYEPYMHARGNIIEYNEIHDTLKRLHDGNVIYFSANGKENVARHNVLYNHPKGAHLRTDDDSHNVLIDGNIIFATDAQRGLQIKGLNTVINNIQFNAYLTTGKAGNTCDPDTIMQRNIVYDTVDTGTGGFHQDLTMLGRTLDYNLYYHVDTSMGEKKFGETLKDGLGDNDRHSILSDPGFDDIENGNLSFRDDSPALRLGIASPAPDLFQRVGPDGDPFLNRFLKWKSRLLFPKQLGATEGREDKQ